MLDRPVTAEAEFSAFYAASYGELARYAAPMFLVMVLAVVLLTAFPELVTWLPQRMAG